MIGFKYMTVLLFLNVLTYSNAVLWLFWEGSSTLPVMYRNTLASMETVFGKQNITILSTSLKQSKSLPSIWNISVFDIIEKIPEGFTRRDSLITCLKSHKHRFAAASDVMRLVLLYLYGGMYSDFDALWLKRPLDDNILVTNTRKKKTRISNGFIKFKEPGHLFLENSLKNIAGTCYRRRRDAFGMKLLTSVYHTIAKEVKSDVTFIQNYQMYGVAFNHARRCFYTTDQCPLKLPTVFEKGIYHLHVFGSRTRLTKGTLPIAGSLYGDALDFLNLSSNFST